MLPEAIGRKQREHRRLPFHRRLSDLLSSAVRSLLRRAFNPDLEELMQREAVASEREGSGDVHATTNSDGMLSLLVFPFLGSPADPLLTSQMQSLKLSYYNRVGWSLMTLRKR